jgi:hypothetical protein
VGAFVFAPDEALRFVAFLAARLAAFLGCALAFLGATALLAFAALLGFLAFPFANAFATGLFVFFDFLDFLRFLLAAIARPPK